MHRTHDCFLNIPSPLHWVRMLIWLSRSQTRCSSSWRLNWVQWRYAHKTIADHCVDSICCRGYPCYILCWRGCCAIDFHSTMSLFATLVTLPWALALRCGSMHKLTFMAGCTVSISYCLYAFDVRFSMREILKERSWTPLMCVGWFPKGVDRTIRTKVHSLKRTSRIVRNERCRMCWRGANLWSTTSRAFTCRPSAVRLCLIRVCYVDSGGV